jgi:hypothetical protein
MKLYSKYTIKNPSQLLEKYLELPEHEQRNRDICKNYWLANKVAVKAGKLGTNLRKCWFLRFRIYLFCWKLVIKAKFLRKESEKFEIIGHMLLYWECELVEHFYDEHYGKRRILMNSKENKIFLDCETSRKFLKILKYKAEDIVLKKGVFKFICNLRLFELRKEESVISITVKSALPIPFCWLDNIVTVYTTNTDGILKILDNIELEEFKSIIDSCFEGESD